MAQSDRTVDVQFTGELLPELIKSLKTFTQTAHIVFGVAERTPASRDERLRRRLACVLPVAI